MVKKLLNFMLLGLLVFSVSHATAQPGISFGVYHPNNEVRQILEKLQKANPAATKLHNIATSPGGEDIQVLEIGANLKGVPAVFVGANFEGNVPLSTEGALYFAKMLLDSAQYTKNLKWYILAQPNPDAASGYFAKTKYGRTVNNFEINNDVDEAVNEDGYDDLNGDGYITQMRVKDLEGTYIVSKNDPRIMVKADATKGEKGEYKLYDEGIDNDKDGQYNEDGEGGINVGIGFPHLFPRDKKEAGLWSGQTPEVYNLMRFIYDRPEIAMVFTLGNSDFCVAPPKGGRKGGANLQNIKIPGRYARMLGVDANQSFSMDEVIEMMKQRVPAGVEVTPAMVAGMLGLGAAVNPLDEDLKFYTKFSEDYKKYLAAKKFNTERLDAPGDKDGSFELWAYYHLGVPSFSMNLFTVPKVKEEKKTGDSIVSLEEIEKMSADEFVALGDDKITAFLKANNAPKRFTAESVKEMMNSGKINPKQMAGMMKNSPKKEKEGELGEKDKALLAYVDKTWEGKGFVQWQSYKHPTLGEVEIGGYIPYLETTPKPEQIDSLLQTQLPWLLQLSTKLPQISIADEKVTDLGGGIYKLELYIENKGYLPYPIAMGQRNSQPAPVVVILDGEIKLLEGIKRTPLGAIGGNSVKKLTWMIQSDKKPEITAKIESTIFGSTEKQIKIGG
ncbi:MAG TPA: M14 family metallopeptidase [Draconibacterium sp.]|nr:M14 family metallopeptidase [Draconibacterium sp.]